MLEYAWPSLLHVCPAALPYADHAAHCTHIMLTEQRTAHTPCPAAEGVLAGCLWRNARDQALQVQQVLQVLQVQQVLQALQVQQVLQVQ